MAVFGYIILSKIEKQKQKLNGDRKMNGTEKQQQWAKDIKESFRAAFDEMQGKVPATHQKMFSEFREKIFSIENPVFWIEYRNYANMGGINKLAQLAASGQLKTRGSEFGGTSL